MELTPELQEKKRLMINCLKKTYKVQYDAVQPIPYIRDRLYCVDKVFVEGGVEVSLAPELTRDTGGSWERLESYKNIYTDFRLNFKRRIIQGEPGYGKSTLTLQLAYDWCNDVWNSSMRKVEILILLRLRQLGGIHSIYRAIKLLLLADECQVTVDDIQKVIQSCSSVNIILDGYDEYPNRDSNNDNDVDKMIVMELFQNVDVTVTTRYLPQRLIRETKRAKLTGFDEQARDEYIRKAVVGDNDEAVEQIKRMLYENSVLADIRQVPLIFVMFAHMAHDLKYVMKFTSVTQFFKYMIRCFHEHLKRKFSDTRYKDFTIHELEHRELDGIAFEGLNKKNQQLTWNKEKFKERVGQAVYEQYILIGLLVEEQVVSGISVEGHVLYTTEVRFYHKLFCEWYAAHSLVSVLLNELYLENALRFLDPFDLQYLFRFACGLNKDAGKKLIDYLKKRPGGDKFAILCILEQSGEVNDIMGSVKDLCSRDVKIKKGDNALLQRSTTQLLEIASNNNIPISCLHLDYSSVKFEGDTLMLHNGKSLPKLPTVEKIHIDGSNTETLQSKRNRYRRHGDAQSANQEILTEKDILNLFRYGMKCRRIKELMFGQLQLPSSVSPKALTNIMKTRIIRVCWRPFDIAFHLDLQSGQWEAVDIRMLENIRCSSVSIDDKHSVLQQRSTVQLLHVAHRQNIPISCLNLDESFSKIDAGDVILHSGLHLSCPVSVKKVVINTMRRREMTETEVIDILMFVQQSHILEELEFDGCPLPSAFSSESIPAELQSRKIKVSWSNYGYSLNLQSGLWEVCDIDKVKRLCTEKVDINYDDSELLQRCTIKLLESASYHDITISCLYLYKSFSKIDAGDVILHSGLCLSCPVSVKGVVINTVNEGRELTETDVVDILMFVQESHLLKTLKFFNCLLPQSIPDESIPSILKSRNVEVSWGTDFLLLYTLNLQSCRWMRHGTKQEITDTEYYNKVSEFRTRWRHTEWQKARLATETQ